MKHLLTFISFFIVVSLTTPHFVFDTTNRISTENGVDENSSTTKAKYTWNYRTITYSL